MTRPLIHQRKRKAAEPGNGFPRLCMVFIGILWLLLNFATAQNVKLRLDENDTMTSGFFTQANSDFLILGANGNASGGTKWNWSRVSKSGSAIMDIEGRTTLTLETTAAQTYILSLDGSGSFAGSLLRARQNGTNVFTVSTTGAVVGGSFTGSGAGLTGVSLTTGVSGTLPVANGGTGITSLGAGVQTFWGTPSSANLAAAVTNETGSGALVFATSPTFTTPALGTPSSVVLTNGTLLPLTTGVTGVLPLANGGTGSTTATAARAALGLDRALFVDQKATAVTGDAVASGGWRTLTLNTELFDTANGFSVSGNVITVAAAGAGSGFVRFWVPFYGTSTARARLRRTNGTAATLAIGTTIYSWSGNYVTSASECIALVTLAAGDTLELQGYVQATGNVGYTGDGTSGEVNVFSTLEFFR